MHHHNTILGQMLKIFSRYEFQKAVSETKTEYHARGFSSWNHFVAMLFGQLSSQDSLRGIEAGLATQGVSLYHAGVKPVHRSTLAYANEHRSHELFKKIFLAMLSKCQGIAPRHKFRFKNPLHSIDATTIDLCLSLYNWAKFRTTKGAVKLHVKLNHSGYLPTFAVVTTGKTHETQVAPSDALWWYAPDSQFLQKAAAQEVYSKASLSVLSLPPTISFLRIDSGFALCYHYGLAQNQQNRNPAIQRFLFGDSGVESISRSIHSAPLPDRW